ncbi:PepSY domain-containing protein [Bradyrhizobium sp. WSM 1791]|uniref:PepSY domain-containing protein n=2 Tax=Bradyrhizobium australiense TaxID=2721161 RepID=A0A7Y4LXR8_9BRAD|nr:PepSY domain-containing protein [Bradyrhizobium australiense]NOJ42812.1 PepSY domain-containing protein [Bradyrhizobium australiense]
MPAQQVIEKALKAGYTQVTKLEADDGRWEGEGIKNGQKMDFRADPRRHQPRKTRRLTLRSALRA